MKEFQHQGGMARPWWGFRYYLLRKWGTLSQNKLNMCLKNKCVEVKVNLIMIDQGTEDWMALTWRHCKSGFMPDREGARGFKMMGQCDLFPANHHKQTWPLSIGMGPRTVDGRRSVATDGSVSLWGLLQDFVIEDEDASLFLYVQETGLASQSTFYCLSMINSFRKSLFE